MGDGVSLPIVARADIGVPAPGTRPLLAKNLGDLVVHYTGVIGFTGLEHDVYYAKSVASYGMVAGKAFEYNYLIGHGGTVFEQAGEYRAAHCLNYNDRSIGVLLMLGIGVQPMPAMITAFVELRAWLTATGALAANHRVSPHYRFRSTGCPGNTLAALPGARWASPTGEGSLGDLIPALLATPQPAPIPHLPPTGDDMTRLVQPDDGDPAVFSLCGTIATWINSEADLNVARLLGTVPATTDRVPRHVLKSYRLVGPAPTYPTRPAHATVAADFASWTA